MVDVFCDVKFLKTQLATVLWEKVHHLPLGHLRTDAVQRNFFLDTFRQKRMQTRKVFLQRLIGLFPASLKKLHYLLRFTTIAFLG